MPRPHIAVQYLEALDEGDLAGAAACFADDAIYCVPTAPTPGAGALGDDIHWLVGREAIQGHLARRGTVPIRHVVGSLLIDGRLAALRGTVALGQSRVAVFSSWAHVDDAGSLDRYVVTSVALPEDDAATLLRESTSGGGVPT